MLGTLLKRLRRRLPHFQTATQFATSIECSVEHYRRIESGKAQPSEELVQTMIEHLELGPDQVLGVWICWGMERVPPFVRRQIRVIPRNGMPELIAAGVRSEVEDHIELGTQDIDEIVESIDKTIKKREIKWR